MVGKTLRSKERALILKVLAFFEREKELSKFLIPIDPTKITQDSSKHKKLNKKIMLPVDQPVNRTCAATGISKSTLMRIKREMKQVASSVSPVPGTSKSAPIPRPSTPGKKRKQSAMKINLDSFDLIALRNMINSFYTVKKEVPTLRKLLAAAKKDLNFPGERTTLRSIIVNQLGYQFKKCKNARLILIQKADIAAWRAHYLRRIKENYDLGAHKKPVTYIGETRIDSHYTVKKCWLNSSDSRIHNNTNPGQRWILVHASGENGFIPGAELLYQCKTKPGDNHDEMDTKTFVQWLKEKLIPNLPQNGIVVIDNAPYYSTQAEKIPCRSSSKSVMQGWLTKNNICFEEEMTETELYHLITNNKPPKKYVVDELLMAHGHEVLRLPPYHCDLNPIEYIWDLIKQRVAVKNVDQLERHTEIYTNEAIQSITVTDWKKVVNHVEKLQKEYWKKDRLQEIIEREFIISLGGEESSSEKEDDQGDSDHSNSDHSDSELYGKVETYYSDDSE